MPVMLSDVGRAAEGRVLFWGSFIPLEAEPGKRPEEEGVQGQDPCTDRCQTNITGLVLETPEFYSFRLVSVQHVDVFPLNSPELFYLQISDEDKVMLCCLESSQTALSKNQVIQACLDELCHSAIKAICQVHCELINESEHSFNIRF